MSKCVMAVLLSVALGAGPGDTGGPRLVRVDLNSGPGGGLGNLYLLAQTAVQEDLRLRPEQLELVRDIVRELVEKQQAFKQEKDPARRKELADEAVRFRLRYDRLASGLLTPTQAERLKQLSLHYRTTASFWDPEVRAALKITDEQFGRMKTLATKTYSEWNRATEAEYRKDRDFPAYQKKLAENQARRNREQVRVLTPEQQAKWKQMLGDPFDGPIPSPILVPVVAQAPPAPRPPAVPSRRPTGTDGADAVARLAGAVETLVQEVTRLNQDVRRLQQENDRLRAEVERLRSRSGKPKAAADGRFLDRGDYVEDTKTGLLWQKDGTASGKMNYYDAIKYAASAKLGGHYGWRVPTKEELAAIFPATDAPFTNTKYNPAPYGKGSGEWNSYWTSDLDPRLGDYAYVYHWYAKGGANNCFASKNFVYVRCVHDPIKK